MKRYVATLLIALVGVPWSAIPVAQGASCSMPQSSEVPACSYCAPTAPVASAVPSLEASCCRFLPTPESIPAQAGSIDVSSKLLQSPEFAAALPAIDGSSLPAAPAACAHDACGASPPHAPPTRTTHLLL